MTESEKTEKLNELMNKISFALKDATLAQGFEIICKRLRECEQNAEVKVYPVNFDYKKQYQELLKRYDDLLEENEDLKAQIEKMKCCGNCDNVGTSGVMGCFCYQKVEFIYPHCVCEYWRFCDDTQNLGVRK